MTSHQIKKEIQKILDTASIDVLQELLDLLQKAQKQTKDQTELSTHLRKIIDEDRELLEKLAQ